LVLVLALDMLSLKEENLKLNLKVDDITFYLATVKEENTKLKLKVEDITFDLDTIKEENIKLKLKVEDITFDLDNIREENSKPKEKVGITMDTTITMLVDLVQVLELEWPLLVLVLELE